MKKSNFASLLTGIAISTQLIALGQTKPKTTSTAVKAAVKQVVVAPPDPILMTIGSEEISKSEFDRVYRKNNRDSVYSETAIKEYLDLYINYKLKVREAEALQMDTSETFKSELAGYRKQLAAPYLTDKDVSESLVLEAYNRLSKDVRASHILLKLDQNALPKDSIAVYNRIMKVRDMITKGADFNKVARDSSEDPSAKENGGDLGYFTGMQMVYPFETAAYNSKPGQVTMPVRTRFGYHLIKVVDVRPAQGEIHVAHIMVRVPKEPNDSLTKVAQSRINEAMAAVKGGMPWDTAVTTFSEDKGSMKRGGELPWFGTGRMVPEFEKAAFALKNVGDISNVITTSYGMHIIKLLEKRGVPSFDEKKAELKQMIARDSRSEASKTSMINKIKKEYKFKEVPKSKDEIFALLDTNLSEGNWDLNKADKYTKDMIIFTDSLGKTTAYNQEAFAKFISTHQTKRQGVNPLVIGISMYNDWVGESCLSYEENRLDQKYADFKNLMKEYRDGILLFDLTDKMVWSKAVKDTFGLEDYYELNKSKYMWGERCEASIFAFADQKNVAVFRKAFNKGKKSVDEIVAELNKTNANAVTKRDGKYNKGEEIINMIDWQTGLSKDIIKNDGVYLVNVTKILPPMPKTIDEVRGSITSDYQSYLEKTWIEGLRAKYPVKVDDKVLETLWKK